MNLKDYIKDVLVSITEAVEESKKESPLSIAPGLVEGKKITDPQFIKFEVAVTTSNEAGGGINVLPFKAEGSHTTENINRISFEVPVYFNAKTK